MHAFIHKIKTILDDKKTEYITADNTRMFIRFDETSGYYVISAGALFITFDSYVAEKDCIKLYEREHYIGSLRV